MKGLLAVGILGNIRGTSAASEARIAAIFPNIK